MQEQLDNSSEANRRIYESWSIGIFAVPALLVLVLVGLAMSHSGASDWVSDAAQAEFVGFNFPDSAPTQLAQPGKAVQSVKAY